MAEQYVTKVQRQHSSMVTSIPLVVRVKLGLKLADHIVWQVDEQSKFVQIFKVIYGGLKDDGNKRNSDRPDSVG